jgi:hypothetical protein
MYKKIINFIATIRFAVYLFVYSQQLRSQGRNYFQNGSLNLAKASRFELNEKNVFDCEVDFNLTLDDFYSIPMMNYPIFGRLQNAMEGYF